MFAEELDISIGDPPELNISYFEQWLQGKSLNSDDNLIISSSDFTTNGPKFVGSFRPYDIKLQTLSKMEKADQYRLFNQLEHYLSYPLILAPHLKIWFQISPPIQEILIKKYYSYDDSVMKEIILKKLPKSRKDLDDISETTKYPLISVTRQSENIKRIYQMFEESKQFQGNLIKYLEANFLLPINLCQRYASVTFLIYSKFNLTLKKKLSKIPCISLENCASVIMALLLPDNVIFNSVAVTHTSECTSLYIPDCLLNPIGNEKACWDLIMNLCLQIENIEPDKTFLVNLRELRNLLTGDTLDAVAIEVKNRLNLTAAGQQIANKLASGGKIRLVIKSILIIGAHLSQTREFRDFLEDILTKVGDILEEAGLTSTEATYFLSSCSIVGEYVISLNSSSGTVQNRRMSGSEMGGVISRNASLSINSNLSREGSSGLPVNNISNDIGSTNSTIATSSARSTRGDSISNLFSYGKVVRQELYRDWVRFLTCCRLCLEQILKN